MSSVPAAKVFLPSPDMEALVAERRSLRKQMSRAKRLSDLARIVALDFKSEDGLCALQIFPKEIWTMIRSYLHNPRDLENFRNTCTLFLSLIEEYRIRDILVPLALEIPEFRHSLRMEKYDDETGRQLMPLRLVCKRWRNTVDRLEEQRLLTHLRSNKFEERSRFSSDAFTPTISLDEEEGNQHLVQKWLDLTNPNNNPDNPTPTPCTTRFLQRSLKIFMPEYEDFQQLLTFSASFVELLERVGSQLISFELELCLQYMDNDGMNKAEVYAIIHRWLLLMPNLQFLSLQVKTEEWPFLTEPDLALRSRLKENPFPTLKKLEKLSFCAAVGPQFSEVLEEIIDRNPHVRNVWINGSFEEITESLLEKIRGLPLEGFSGRFPCPEEGAAGQLESFRKILNTNWPLTKLKLHFSSKTLEMQELFELLQIYPNLEDLALILGWLSLKGSGGSLKLKKLKHFHFDFSCQHTEEREAEDLKYSWSVDYLLNCPELETLSWLNRWGFRRLIVDKPVPVVELGSEMITFQGGMADLGKSNIWEVFSKLRTVETLDHTMPRMSPVDFFYQHDWRAHYRTHRRGGDVAKRELRYW